MIADAEQNEEAKIASRTIHNFPDECRGEQKANLMKASRWCKDRDSTTTSLSNKRRKSGTTKAINSVCQRGSRRLLEKKAMMVGVVNASLGSPGFMRNWWSSLTDFTKLG